jgi:hypothetical protein
MRWHVNAQSGRDDNISTQTARVCWIVLSLCKVARRMGRMRSLAEDDTSNRDTIEATMGSTELAKTGEWRAKLLAAQMAERTSPESVEPSAVWILHE